MALTKAVSSLIDWTAVAQKAAVKTGVLDVSDAYSALLHIQAFLADETASSGVEFIVQGSSAAAGDEDWYDIARFVDLVATAAEEAQTDNPWATNDKTCGVAATAGYTSGLSDCPLQWIAIEDGTLVDSELMMMTAGVANTSITVLDDKAVEHAQNTVLSNTAMSKIVVLGIEHYRVRLIVNNTYDINGATLNYRVRAIKITGL